MEKLTFNNEQLEFLKFIVQDFEYNDDHERYMIEQIENKIYQAQENQALKLLIRNELMTLIDFDKKELLDIDHTHYSVIVLTQLLFNGRSNR